MAFCGFLCFNFLSLLTFSKFWKNFHGGGGWQVEMVEDVLLWVTPVTQETESVTHIRSCLS